MYKQLVFASLFILIFTVGTLFAQDTNLTLATGHHVVIDGTSNVRDWDARATTIQGELILNEFEGGIDSLQPQHFESLKIQIPVEDIDTDTRRLTRNIHSYLKADIQPVITFELSQVREIHHNGSNSVITAEGVVTAAGQSHTTEMRVTAQQDNNGAIRFTGNQALKMTDFAIKPPTAMLGTIRAVDDISIIYDVSFIQ